MRYLKIIQILISLILFYLILRKISLQEMHDTLASVLINTWYFTAAMIVPFVGLIAGALRFRLILALHNISISFRRIVVINLVGAFYNQVFPSTIGGDVVRGIMLRNTQISDDALSGVGTKTIMVIAMIGTDRLIGIIGVILTGTIAFLLNPLFIDYLKQINFTKIVLYAIPVSMGVGCLCLLLVTKYKNNSNKHLWIAYNKINVAINWLRVVIEDKKKFAFLIGLSIVTQLAVVLEYFMLTMALNLHIEAFDLAVIIPVVDLVSLLPVSIGGIGLRENTLFLIGNPIGFTPTISVSLSYLYLGIKILWGLPGGLLQLKERFLMGKKMK